MSEQRRQDRQRTFIAARLLIGIGGMSTPCSLRDISEEGARVKIDPRVAIPDQFVIEAPARNFSRRCVIRWRKGEEIGVAFIDDEVTPKSSEERIAELEAENAQLRRQLKVLRTEIEERLAMES